METYMYVYVYVGKIHFWFYKIMTMQGKKRRL